MFLGPVGGAEIRRGIACLRGLDKILGKTNFSAFLCGSVSLW